MANNLKASHPEAWVAFLARHPDAHILQTSAWGALKADFGWQVEHVIAGDCGAQILFRKLPLGFTLAYIPKGPVGDTDCWDSLWDAVDARCRQRRAIFLKVEPDLWEREADSLWGGQPPSGFRLSPHGIQPRRTLVVDISLPEDEILARMKQKTRYNIRLAARKGVTVAQSGDVETFHALMQVTSARDAFGVHTLAYYRRALEQFTPRGEAVLLLAAFDGQPLAGLMVFARGTRAWYFYGASSNEHRRLMPAYLLQWEAMRWAKARGCRGYDLWGVPDEDEAALEANFMAQQGGLWGVYRFKRGFGGRLYRSAPAWDRVYIPWAYRFYLWKVGGRAAGQ